jgi:salicylate hydroxylase
MKVIIIGGGIAGLAAAIAVARTSNDVLLFEQSPRIDERGAGLQIGPNGIKALDWLGVWEGLRSDTQPPSFLHIMDGVEGACLRSMTLAGSFDRRFGAPYVVTRRSDLLQSLLTRARSLPNVEMRMGCAIAGFTWHGETPAIRTTAGEETADAVIGADGTFSTLRRFLHDDGDMPIGKHFLYRALVPRDQAPSVSQDILLWLCPGGHVVHYPVACGKMVNFVAVSEAAGGTSGEAADIAAAEVAAAFPGISPELRYVLGLAQKWRRWRSFERTSASRWGRGAATLIGDAAHPMAPYLAQGAAAALEDAVTLGQAFQALRGEPGPVAAFRAMERRRMARTLRMSRMSSRQGQLYHASGPTALLRNLLLRYLPTSFLMSRINWIYEWRP